MTSLVRVCKERTEHTYRSARRHVTQVCCAITVFFLGAQEESKGSAVFRRWWVNGDGKRDAPSHSLREGGNLHGAGLGDSQNPSSAKRAYSAGHRRRATAPQAPPQAGFSLSLALSLSYTLSHSLPPSRERGHCLLCRVVADLTGWPSPLPPPLPLLPLPTKLNLVLWFGPLSNKPANFAVTRTPHKSTHIRESYKNATHFF